MASLVPTQDQIMGQLRVVIPALGTIASAFGIAGATSDKYVNLALASSGFIAWAISSAWSLSANSRASIMASAAKPVAPGVPAPQIVLPKEEAALAETLPANVTSPPEKT